MCVPAVVVAAGSSYDTDICKDRFHPTRNSGKVNGTKGLWQVCKKKQPVAPHVPFLFDRRLTR